MNKNKQSEKINASKKIFSEKEVELLANRFKILSEPIRLKIICSISVKEKNVSQIVKELGTYQSNVSKHLQMLLDGGIIQCRISGNKHYYKLIDKAIIHICKKLCKSFEMDEEGFDESCNKKD